MLSSVPRIDEEILRAAIQMNVDVGCGSQWEETVILDHLLLPAEFYFDFHLMKYSTQGVELTCGCVSKTKRSVTCSRGQIVAPAIDWCTVSIETVDF